MESTLINHCHKILQLAEEAYTCLELVFVLSAGVVVAILVKAAGLRSQDGRVGRLIAPSCVPVSPVPVAVNSTAVKL